MENISIDWGVILSYGLFFDVRYNQWITIEATKYDEHTKKPITWAIRRCGSVMSKFTGSFDHEPMPSSRDEEFFKEYRFLTIEEAVSCWNNYQN